MRQEYDMQDLIRLDMVVSHEDSEPMAGLMGLRLSCGWEEIDQPDGGTLFRVHLENPSLAQNLAQEVKAWFPTASLTRTELENKDWTLAWREFFTPVPIRDRFIVVAPWMEEAKQSGNGKLAPIIIDPRMAFGTGHHASTALCLEAISDLAQKGSICPGSRFLDVGTGSGILAIACAKIGMWGIACDIDPLSVENAVYNREVNRVTSSIDIRMGSIESVEGDQFDCVIANILAEPLIEMSSELAKLLTPTGKLILSGILTTQAGKVEKAFSEQGFKPATRLEKDEWTALVW